MEFLTGADPTNPADAWKFEVRPGKGHVDLILSKRAGVAYEVQVRSSLGPDQPWQYLDVPGNRAHEYPATDQVATLRDEIHNDDQIRFYRVVLRGL